MGIDKGILRQVFGFLLIFNEPIYDVVNALIIFLYDAREGIGRSRMVCHSGLPR